jgi:hypothetical protein
MAEFVNQIRRLILFGAFNMVDASTRAPTSNLMLFLSSTFTDTQAERNYIMDVLLFELRELAEKHQIQVVFGDMRTGVRDESSLDHDTWNVCRDVLNYCRKNSSGLFFFSLQGDKYGYRPLPKSILKADFDDCVANTKEDVRDTVLKWYVLDTNATPLEYVLRNRVAGESHDVEFWAVMSKSFLFYRILNLIDIYTKIR